MRGLLSEYGIFFREFRRNFHATGAICPSGRWLSGALCRCLAAEGPPRRILEVGPGTGAVTRRIVARMRNEDRLDLVELNPSFVARLNERLTDDGVFRRVAPRTRVFCQPIESLADCGSDGEGGYDVIISGLPLNNFEVGEVRDVISTLRRLAKPGGTLSFFEYMAVRRLRGAVGGPRQRARLRGIGQLLNELLESGEFRRDWVWANTPPAWVHHVRLESPV